MMEKRRRAAAGHYAFQPFLGRLLTFRLVLVTILNRVYDQC
jgi:hypothetical protein